MWPDLVSNPGPLALETDAGWGYIYQLTRLVAAGMGWEGGLGRGRQTEGCRNKVERCTV